MASAKKTEIAETKPQGSAVAIPDFMKGDQGKGTEGLGMEDVAQPRLALMQATSEQVAAGDARAGEYYHLLAGINLGKSLRIIPILVVNAFMLWRPRKTGGGLLARADDGVHWTPPNAEFKIQLDQGAKEIIWRTAKTVEASGLGKWGSSDPSDGQSQPAATKMLNVLCYLPDYPELGLAIFTFQRSALKEGKKFTGRLKMSSAPAFGSIFTLSNSVATGPSGTYQVPVVTGAGFVEDKGLYESLKAQYEHFTKVGIQVREDGLQGEAEETPGGGEDKGDDNDPFAKKI